MDEFFVCVYIYICTRILRMYTVYIYIYTFTHTDTTYLLVGSSPWFFPRCPRTERIGPVGLGGVNHGQRQRRVAYAFAAGMS